jgi:hypothetical protein
VPCFGPLTGYYAKDLNSTGKRSIVFDPRASFSGVAIAIPCGRCAGCRLERARQWAMRCMHEARMHKDNCFVTLTYRNECLPDNGFLVRRDTQLFFKRLRKARYPGIRYFGSGEYGSLNKRPHYHILLFNCDFPDKKYVSKGKRDGEFYYSSAELAELWPLGSNLLGAVTFDSAAYVAGYVMDKVNGKMADSHYEVYDADGLIHRRPAEFSMISRGSAIGSGYYDKYGHEVYAHDSVVVNGREVRPPRAYDLRFGLTDPDGLVKIKRRRKRLALAMKADNTSRRRRVKEVILLTKLKKRSL